MKPVIYSILLFCPFFLISQESALLDTNNIAARIDADGSLFKNKFEVPKGNKLHNTIAYGNIWIGGYDTDNLLHIASNRYPTQNNSDYFYGPLAQSYYDSDYITKYDKVWKIDKSEIENHIANFNKAGYVIPNSIANWPGNGNVSNGEAEFLAPYIDINLNKIYDPENGDYPDIRGDQAIYFIINDEKQIHTSSNSNPLGIEVHGMAYSFASIDSSLNQSVFVNFQVFNHSQMDYHNLYFSVLTNNSVFAPLDSVYIGCDSSLNMSYVYSGSVNGLFYGTNSPAQACLILNQAMSSFMYFINASSGNPIFATTDPKFTNEYYRYMSNHWRDGTPLTQGGIGYNPSSTDITRFAFPGDPNNGGWTDQGDVPWDKSGLTTLGPMDFKSGTSICVDVAFPYARDYNGTNLTSISLLKQRVKSIQSFYNNQGYHCAPIRTEVHNEYMKNNLFSIYPNPNIGKFNIEFTNIKVNNNYNVEIYNSLNQKVFSSGHLNSLFLTQQGTNNITIDLSTVPAGIYFVKVSNGREFNSKKIVIE